MKKIFLAILNIGIGIGLGIFIAKNYMTQLEPKTNNVTVSVGDFLNKTQKVSYLAINCLQSKPVKPPPSVNSNHFILVPKLNPFP